MRRRRKFFEKLPYECEIFFSKMLKKICVLGIWGGGQLPPLPPPPAYALVCGSHNISEELVACSRSAENSIGDTHWRSITVR